MSVRDGRQGDPRVTPPTRPTRKLSTTVSMDSVRFHLAASLWSHRAHRSRSGPTLPSKPAMYSMSMVSKDVLAKIASDVAFFFRTAPTTSCGSRGGNLGQIVRLWHESSRSAPHPNTEQATDSLLRVSCRRLRCLWLGPHPPSSSHARDARQKRPHLRRYLTPSQH